MNRLAKIFKQANDSEEVVGLEDQMIRDSEELAGRVLNSTKVVYSNSTYIEYYLASDYDKLRGNSYDEVVIYDEALDEDIIEEAIKPVLRFKKGVLSIK